jgi:hypothetical protein
MTNDIPLLLLLGSNSLALQAFSTAATNKSILPG